MKIEELTPEIVTPIIRQIVAEYGEDYVYKAEERAREFPNLGCVYREFGEPSCLVGHVLDRAGVPYDKYWDLDGDSASTLLKDSPHEDLRIALDAAQTVQDVGQTWGEALKVYEEKVAGGKDVG